MQSWARALQHAVSESGVVETVAATLGQLVAADAAYLGLLDDQEEGAVRTERASGAPDGLLATITDARLCTADPVMNTAVTERRPVHVRMIFDERQWRRQRLFEMAARPSGYHHYLAAPVLDLGGVRGKVVLLRHYSRQGFTDTDAFDTQSLLTQVSLVLQRLEQSPATFTGRLTQRERQLAALIGDGRTNEQAARALGISPNTVKDALKRLYRKHGLRSRAQLAKLV